jgi:hypothetical protein
VGSISGGDSSASISSGGASRRGPRAWSMTVGCDGST